MSDQRQLGGHWGVQGREGGPNKVVTAELERKCAFGDGISDLNIGIWGQEEDSWIIARFLDGVINGQSYLLLKWTSENQMLQ